MTTARNAYANYASIKGAEQTKSDIAWWINEGGKTAEEVAKLYNKSVATVKKIARAATN